MSLFAGVITIKGVAFLMFSLFAIVALGCLLGRITIKGISLGTSGVFIIALLYGIFFGDKLNAVVTQVVDGTPVSIASNALKIVETLGLILFVTSVGFIAGPNFFKNLKKNFKSYIVLGLVVILAGGAACVACYFIGRGAEENSKEFVAMLVGIL